MSSLKDMAFIDGVEKKDGVQNGRKTDHMGQYFAMGTLKFVY